MEFTEKEETRNTKRLGLATGQEAAKSSAGLSRRLLCSGHLATRILAVAPRFKQVTISDRSGRRNRPVRCSGIRCRLLGRLHRWC